MEHEFKKPPKLLEIFKKGDVFSKLSFVILGAANFAGGQIIKGFLFLILEIIYFAYMFTVGFSYLGKITTLGTVQQGMVFNEEIGIFEMTAGDNSMLILLYGVATLVITVAFVALWVVSIRSGEMCRQYKLANKKAPSIVEDIKGLFDYNIHRLFLFIPTLGIVVFTVTPLIYMVLMAFTNYDAEHQPPGNLFTWVGLENFKLIFASSGQMANTFWPILGWTFVWGIAAPFTCYFGGIFLAILINSDGIRGKKIWRTIFVLTMAIPVFISLLVVSTMLGKTGIVNVLLEQWGFITEPLPFLTNAAWARGTVIVVNMWVGIPITMMMVTGILMNIPKELYESAHIDGAGPVVTFVKITFPYMIFVTTPYLITNLISNFNNFGVIYFLTEGSPMTLDYFKGAGKTDLLVTWLYKLTKDSKDYNLAAAIGILIFIISASFSLITYSRSKALKDEEGFQ